VVAVAVADNQRAVLAMVACKGSITVAQEIIELTVAVAQAELIPAGAAAAVPNFSHTETHIQVVMSRAVLAVLEL
jgi:hypothetical protein